MVYGGAQLETAAELQRALRFPDDVHGQLGRQLAALRLDADGRKLSLANALWVQQSFELEPEFLGLARQHYGAGASQVDFIGAPDQAVATVNRWAEEQTAGRIRGLIKRSDVNELTRLILTSAAYFKADWLHPFPASATANRPFRLADGSSLSTPMMRQRGQFRLLDEAGFDAVELPYKGEEMSMLLFIPEQPDGLPQFERGLDAIKLNGWIEATRAALLADVELIVPKLETQLRASLVPELQAMGMQRIFGEEAQLRGIADARLRLSDVIHQTYLRVDEKGTEAAAVTAAIAEVQSMPRAVHADRPFFMAIRDNRTGALVFIGRIEKPEAPGR
jgi:serine protease inhibitor